MFRRHSVALETAERMRIGSWSRALTALAATVAVLCLAAGHAWADTWMVLSDGTGDAPTIQAAVDLAQAGDTVLVGPGTYTDIHMDGGGEFVAVEMKSGVALRSTDGATSTVIDVTSSNISRGMVCRNCDSATVIEGFKITGGDTFAGAGMLIYGGAPRILDCIFFDAYGGMGGGMHVTGSATPEIAGNLFDENEACCGLGGAILIDDGSAPTVTDNVFTGNVSFGGGAIALQNADGLIEDNEFTGNTGTGGGALAVWSGSPVVRGNTFVANHSTAGGGAVAFKFSGETQFHDNILTGNTADGSGGGIQVSGASPEIHGTTIVGNTALQGGGIFITDSASPELERVIVAMNSGFGGIVCEDPGSSPTFRCCNVFGNEGIEYGGQCGDPTGWNGNISLDPLFCDAQDGDYALCDTSPAAPGNHPDGEDCGLIGALDVACVCAATAVEEETWGAIKSMYR